MKIIFLDESGDLGFKLTSSKFFSITLLCCDDTDVKRLRNIPKKIRTQKLKKTYKQQPELKANNTNDILRRRILKKIKKLNIEIHTIILEKENVYEYLRNRKHVLYNYISNLIISECSFEGNRIELIVDKRGGKVLSDKFSDYITKKFKELNPGCIIDIYHFNSRNDGGLQMADFISWAIFRKYESKDESFYNIVEEKITTEKKMFKYGP